MDTAQAVDAVAWRCNGSGRRRSAVPTLAAGLAAFGVVADDQRVVVDQCGLKPAVGADDDAELLAKPGEVPVQRRGGDHHEEKQSPVLGGGARDHRVHMRQRHEVREEEMRDRCRKQNEQRVLGDSPHHLGRIPRRGVEPAARGRIAVDQPLDGAIDEFEKHRLRAGPAAPDASEQRGDKKQRKAQAGDEEEQQPRFLRGDGPAEEVETPLGHIEEHRWVSTNRNPRQQEIDRDQRPGRKSAGDRPAAARIGRMQEVPRAVVVDGGDGIDAGTGGGHGESSGGGAGFTPAIAVAGRMAGVKPNGA